MKYCSVCGNVINNDNAPALFIDSTGEKKVLCSICGRRRDVLYYPSSTEEKSEAVEYFYNSAAKLPEGETKAYLLKTLREVQSTPFVDRSKEKSAVSANMALGQFVGGLSKTGSSMDFWITGMKLIMWVVFIGIILSGLVLAVMSGSISGLFILLGAFILAFVSVAASMIFLNIATDLRAVRRALEKRE